jgi:hypothetical protein
MIDYGRIYKDIMSLKTGVCDRNGITMFSQHREGMKNLLSPEESKKSLVLAINAWKIRNGLASKIGKGKYALAEYEKIKRITTRWEITMSFMLLQKLTLIILI